MGVYGWVSESDVPLSKAEQDQLYIMRNNSLKAEEESKLYALASAKYLIFSLILISALVVSLLLNAKGHSLFSMFVITGPWGQGRNKDILPTTIKNLKEKLAKMSAKTAKTAAKLAKSAAAAKESTEDDDEEGKLA